MKYATALIAAAVGAQAWTSKNGTQIVTEVVDQYVTYCPGPTHITHGDKVYTVTKRRWIKTPIVSITNVPLSTAAPSNPANTEPAATEPAATVPAPATTGGLVMTPTKGQPSTVPTAGAGKAAALSGAGLAGIVGLAAFVL
ncbi:hypothetical protein E4U60_005701 [Claviceps pazoutovae]|uniref:Uncharacterized protein n=1 Tax=Claviceps pazoutovae TaxID=1649127 RepID=A0A9P7MHL3_9HYPO|nr:hypothetical protein E4U60_005701 [Claviceps pazoutovae]